MRSVGQHGGVIATVAAALNVANGAPLLADGATHVLVDTGLQSTCVHLFEASGITRPTPPTGDFGLPFALLDGGSCKLTVRHGGTLHVATVGGGTPTTVAKAVYAPTFTIDITSVGVIE